jgi:hypothetical protein
VGRAGIKKRKKYRRADAEPSVPISEGDVDRLFGRFTWNAYSPAGAMERGGFFLRQANRSSRNGRRKITARVVRLVVVLVLIVFAADVVFQIARHVLDSL